MKLEILRSGDEVEIHRQNDDGTKTVWICENEQAALFKLASLITTREEDPKQAKRSILVGTFGKKGDSAKRKPALDDLSRKLTEELEKQGLEKIGNLEKLPPEDPPSSPYATKPGVNPFTPIGVGTVPYGPYTLPNTGGIAIPTIWDGTTGIPVQPWTDVSYDVTNQTFTSGAGSQMTVFDVPLNFVGQAGMNIFKTSVKLTG